MLTISLLLQPSSRPTNTPSSSPTLRPSSSPSSHPTKSVSPSAPPTHSPTKFRWPDHLLNSEAEIIVHMSGNEIWHNKVDICSNGAKWDYTVNEHCPSPGIYTSKASFNIPKINSKSTAAKFMYWNKLSFYADINFDDGHHIECEFVIEESFSYTSTQGGKYMLGSSMVMMFGVTGFYLRKRRIYSINVDDENKIDQSFIGMEDSVDV